MNRPIVVICVDGLDPEYLEACRAPVLRALAAKGFLHTARSNYAMHTYGLEHPKSQEHISILDDAIGELVEAHPDITLLLTADHGMSRKTRMLDLKGVLGARGIQANPVPIIKDRYVVHHANLGGSIYLYLRPQDQAEALKILKGTPGVEQALGREEAADRFRISPQRIGDIVVNGEVDVVFGDPTEVEMPPQLRSHGSTHETEVPPLGCNGDFARFAFEENRDIGRYIFERVLG